VAPAGGAREGVLAATVGKEPAARQTQPALPLRRAVRRRTGGVVAAVAAHPLPPGGRRLGFGSVAADRGNRDFAVLVSRRHLLAGPRGQEQPVGEVGGEVEDDRDLGEPTDLSSVGSSWRFR